MLITVRGYVTRAKGYKHFCHISRNKKCLNKRRMIDDCLREVSLK